MDLPALKKKYGDKIIFVGGVDKFFFDWDKKQQKAYVRQLVRDTGGGFILMDSGGVPENVTPEGFAYVKELFTSTR
jgi:uroporphyrinogen-III decarboxylase